MASIEILILSILTIVSAVAALESERMSHSIIALALTASFIGTIFLLMGAFYAGVFQLVMYGGVLIILFMAVASFTEKDDDKPLAEEVH